MTHSTSFSPILQIIQILRTATGDMPQPAITQIIAQTGVRNPFFVLISCLLSLRTKDTISLPVSQKLLSIADTPEKLLELPRAQLEKIVFPTGFYRQKARTLHDVAKTLIERFNGQVPQTEKELLSIKGVGRKTANLVLAEAFGIPAICVDTHVHRISNRLGLVESISPKETERQLMKILSQEYWSEINPLLVMWGQNVCTPLSPFCSHCPLSGLCKKVGVNKKR